MLTEAMKEDEGLPESKLTTTLVLVLMYLAEKGKKLAEWLRKPQIVFARTTPAQKLMIVKGNQDLG